MNTELNQNQPKTQVKGIIFLLITAIVWGTSFVSQSVGSEVVRPFTFMGIRTLLGSFVLMPVIFVRDKIQEKSLSPSEIAHKKIKDRRTVVIGLLIGIALCFATNFQQFAFNYSTTGKIAFITASYMFFVPISSIFFKKKLPVVTWICVLLGFIGLYFLCFKKAKISQ